jgi:hypothetical protein
MVASEFPEVDYPGHQVAIAHKQKMVDREGGSVVLSKISEIGKTSS